MLSSRLKTEYRLVRTVNLTILVYFISVLVWSDRSGLSLYSNLLCIVCTLGMLYVVYLRSDLYLPPIVVPILVFYFITLLSIYWAADPDLSIIVTFRTLPLLITFTIVLYNYIALTKQQDILLKYIYISGIVLSVYVILLQGGFSSYRTQLLSGSRVGGNVANLNGIGMSIAASLIIAMYYFIERRDFKSIVSSAILLVVGLGTGSNKFLISILLGFTLTILLASYIKGNAITTIKYFIFISVALITIYYILQLPTFQTMKDRFVGMISTITGKGNLDASAEWRVRLSKTGIQQFLKRPFFGIGIGNSYVIALRDLGLNVYLHNNYIELLVGVGIVGTILYYITPMLIVVKLFEHIRKKYEICIPIFVIIVVSLVNQVGYVSYIDKPWYIYIAIALSFVCLHPYNAEHKI